MRALGPAVAASGMVVALASSVVQAQFLAARAVRRPAVRVGEQIVDEVLASVEVEGDDRPPIFVLRSDVELVVRFTFATGRVRHPAPLTALPDPVSFRSSIEQAVGERLLEREALRAIDPEPTPAEMLQELSALEAQLSSIGGSAALLRAAAQTSDDFRTFVRRRLVVARFLERHLARSIEPSEADLRGSYEREEHGAYRAEGVPFALARGEIRQAMVRQQYPRAIRAYLRSIGSRARIRLWTSDPAEGG